MCLEESDEDGKHNIYLCIPIKNIFSENGCAKNICEYTIFIFYIMLLFILEFNFFLIIFAIKLSFSQFLSCY